MLQSSLVKIAWVDPERSRQPPPPPHPLLENHKIASGYNIGPVKQNILMLNCDYFFTHQFKHVF